MISVFLWNVIFGLFAVRLPGSDAAVVVFDVSIYKSKEKHPFAFLQRKNTGRSIAATRAHA